MKAACLCFCRSFTLFSSFLSWASSARWSSPPLSPVSILSLRSDCTIQVYWNKQWCLVTLHPVSSNNSLCTLGRAMEPQRILSMLQLCGEQQHCKKHPIVDVNKAINNVAEWEIFLQAVGYSQLCHHYMTLVNSLQHASAGQCEIWG